MNEDKCKKCGRKIVWAKMPSGAVTPFVKVVAYVIVKDQAIKIPDSPLECLGPEKLPYYISHYVDCPFAGEFGKNKKPKPDPSLVNYVDVGFGGPL